MTLDSEYADWMKIPAGTLTHQILPFSKYVEPYHHSLWPAGSPYVSPLNPIFLVQCVALAQLNQRENWLIRDGFNPLVHFFRAHPKPVGLRSKIYVEESLAWTVPRAWRDHVGTYRIVSKKARRPLKKFIICGVGLRTFHSEIELKHQLAKLNRRRFRALPVELFLPMKAAANDWQDYHYEYLSTLSFWLGKACHTVNWGDISLKNSFEGYEFIELSGKRLCADSYYVHVVLSKGGYLRGKALESGKGRYVALSPFHGYLIHEKIRRVSVGPQKAPVSILSESDFPWARWFGKWKKFS